MDPQIWIKVLWIALTGVIFTVVSFAITVALSYWDLSAETVLEVRCNCGNGVKDHEGTIKKVE
jgi:hypothetical protein